MKKDLKIIIVLILLYMCGVLVGIGLSGCANPLGMATGYQPGGQYYEEGIE